MSWHRAPFVSELDLMDEFGCMRILPDIYFDF
jgi:hypothetical protein